MCVCVCVWMDGSGWSGVNDGNDITTELAHTDPTRIQCGCGYELATRHTSIGRDSSLLS